jgi:hypothetical protein
MHAKSIRAKNGVLQKSCALQKKNKCVSKKEKYFSKNLNFEKKDCCTFRSFGEKKLVLLDSFSSFEAEILIKYKILIFLK